MQGISLDNAKRLKELGLEHEIQAGDWFMLQNIPQYDDLDGLSYPVPVIDAGYHYGTKCWMIEYQAGWCCENHYKRLPDSEDMRVWLPTLSQLLEEVEKRGYWWWLLKDYEDGFVDFLGGERPKKVFYTCEADRRPEEIWEQSEIQIPREGKEPPNTPEDAVAQALIAILKGE